MLADFIKKKIEEYKKAKQEEELLRKKFEELKKKEYEKVLKQLAKKEAKKEVLKKIKKGSILDKFSEIAKRLDNLDRKFDYLEEYTLGKRRKSKRFDIDDFLFG